MNKILVAVIILVVAYFLFIVFSIVTRLVFRVALVLLIFGVLGFGVVNIADLIPDKETAEKVSGLVDKIPEKNLPGNEIVSAILEEKAVDVETFNQTNGSSIMSGNATQVINGTINSTLTELGNP